MPRLLLVLLLNAPLAAQQPDSSAAARDSSVSEYRQTFPIWGRKAFERGIELSLPLGLNFLYYHMTQDITVSDLAIGFNAPPQPADFITFSSNVAELTMLNARLDLWLFPFLNVYGVVGKGYGNSTITLGAPVELTTIVNFDAMNFGIGLAGFYGIRPFFGVLDYNHQWGSSSLLDAPVPANIVSMRVGWNYRVGQPEKRMRGTFWVGTMFQALKSQTNGAVKLSDVIPAGTDSLFNDYQNAEWYQDLSPPQQALVDEFVQRLQGSLDTAVVNYSLTKAVAEPWNMLLGGTFDVGRHWGLRWELGFIGRRSLLLMGNYRIRI